MQVPEWQGPGSGSPRPQGSGKAGRMGTVLAVAIGVAVVALIGWRWYEAHRSDLSAASQASVAPPAVAPSPVSPAVTPSDAAASAVTTTQPPSPALSASAVAAQTASDEPPPAPADVGRAVAALLGPTAQAALLQTSEFPRRFVATVDNLGRSHAPVLLWPVAPAQGRFSVAGAAQGNSSVIAPDNPARYTALVALIESVDAQRAAKLYRRLYPTLQQAYVDLGYPNRNFHGRLIEVIDLLLATPEPRQPVEVRLTEVKGPVPSTQPWTRYEYTDAALESLAAGQKMLIRTGPAHQKRLKARLAEFRSALTTIDATR
jgi:hypothetical protein